jgi:pre-rRNA-processing protein TSR1
VRKRVPKGTSEYQAAWILDSDEENEDDDDDDDDSETEEENIGKDEEDEEEEDEEIDEEMTDVESKNVSFSLRVCLNWPRCQVR